MHLFFSSVIIIYRDNYFKLWHTLQAKRRRSLILKYSLILLSKDISWLPAITILCLKFRFSNALKNPLKSFYWPYLVKSPACIKISPFILFEIICSSSVKFPWLSDNANILKIFFITINLKNAFVYRDWYAFN